MSDGEHGVFTNLRGTVCACGDAKKAGKSFCRLCYFRLPKALRDLLYKSERYVETYRSALEFLRLEEPRDPAVVAQEEATRQGLAKAFPTQTTWRIPRPFGRRRFIR